MDSPELAGRRLGGRYLLESSIASGGMATVWRGTDEVLGRPVAVKILHENLARDRELLERFRMEAVAAARLSHPAVVRVFDTGIDDGTCYIVMELFEGSTLADLVAAGPLPPGEAAGVVQTALQGLAHAHREGVVHRDVKPSNILVDGEAGLVKMTDFGIAKAAFAGGDLTSTGNLLGTAKYLAPEQVEGGPVDHRADLYAAGLVLYEALTGKAPFEGDNHLATATMRLTKDPTPPGALRSGIDRALDTVVLRALARSPEDRFQSAEEMSAAIDRAAPPSRPRPRVAPSTPTRAARGPSFFRSWMLLPLLLLLLAGLAVGAFFLVSSLVEGASDGGGNPAAALERIPVRGLDDYDPSGGDGENGDAVGLATDGDPATSWTTEGYFQPDLDKPGVGILLDLGTPREVVQVRLRSNLPGWRFQIQASNSPSGFTALPSTEGETAFEARDAMRIELEPATGQYFLIWITEAAPSGDGRYRGDVAEVQLLGPSG